MSALTFPRLAHAHARLPHGIAAFVSREWAYWTARRDMAHLDDAALHDLGIGRSEIDDAVRHGRPMPRRG